MAKGDEPPGGLARVFEAPGYGGALYIGPVRDFDAACDHVVALLSDAATLFERGSYETSAFLAITALEETAKAHVGLYRRDEQEKSKGARSLQGPLRQAKHGVAADRLYGLTPARSARRRSLPAA